MKHVRCSRWLLVVVLGLSVTRQTPGAVFTVTVTNDTGAGSLRQAILDANAAPGADTITFNLAGPGLTIAPGSALPSVTNAVVIDGSTQPGFAGVPLVELNGASAGASSDGLRIANGPVTVRGLVINRFRRNGIVLLGGGTNVIEGNFIGLAATGLTNLGNLQSGLFVSNSMDNVIGGGTLAARNVIGGNTLHGVLIQGTNALRNQVAGNYVGLSATGDIDLGNSQHGVFINGARSNQIGGALVGAGNVIAGNAGSGVRLEGTNAIANLVLGNVIGLNAAGVSNIANAAQGVLIMGAPSNSVGSAAALGRNLISGNAQAGVRIEGASARGNSVTGNWIGLDGAGVADRGNGSHGVHLTSNAAGNNVGGTAAGEGNRIGYSGGDGVFIESGTNNAVRANAVFSNDGLGIDLAPNGATANDAGDVDIGPNLLQNAPVLTRATVHATEVVLEGALNSMPSTAFQLDFFANSATDASGFGEGESYIGSETVTTDASGNASFVVALPLAAGPRSYTATATSPNGDTSELSRLVAASSTLPGRTFTVRNTDDAGPGSLRQALLDANAAFSAGDTIRFEIPGAGPHRIVPASALPLILEPLTIDGWTQAGSAANTLPAGFNAVLQIQLVGTNAGSGVDGLRMAGSNCVVRGLAIVGFRGDGIELVTNAHNARIEGNLIGVGFDGADFGNGADGVFVNGVRGVTIGGLTPEARNVISGNNRFGVQLATTNAIENLVQGNFIGTDAAGSQPVGNTSDGVRIDNAPRNVIGGEVAGAGNVISGNRSAGVEVTGVNASGNRVQGNWIGLDASGLADVGNLSEGVAFSSQARSNLVGGVVAGSANRIAFNPVGVSVAATGANNAIRGNAIFSQDALGIDLGSSGVTANDPGDADTGANQLQNFPVLARATIHPASTQVQGTLNSRPSTLYQVEFFANTACDSSGNGEGAQYLGSLDVTTDASGNGSFDGSLPALATGRSITATATDPDGNTSEFSGCVRAESTIAPFEFRVTNAGDSGPGSLRQALLDANAAISVRDRIVFDIAGSGPHAITPQTLLPVVTDAVVIDAFTQPGASSNTLATADNAVRLIRLLGTNDSVATGLVLSGSSNVVRGLNFGGFVTAQLELLADHNRVDGTFFGFATNDVFSRRPSSALVVRGAHNKIGGTAPGARNVISGALNQGLFIDGARASNNVVQGNLIGTDSTGTNGLGNGSYGIRVEGAPGTLVGGEMVGARNVIAANGDVGVYLSNSSSNQVLGNFIGVDASGVSALGSTEGIYLLRGQGNRIGGAGVGAGNVLSGNRNSGVALQATSGNEVLGNWIGTDVSGQFALGNHGRGVFVDGSSNVIGRLAAGSGNIIAYNTVGVDVVRGTNNPVRGNRVYGDLLQAIDLQDNGLTANDAGDADAGANDQLNYPVLTVATIHPGSTAVQGTFHSAASQSFALDFFSSEVCLPSGAGEAEQYLGSIDLTTDGSGNATFDVVLPMQARRRYISATATDAFGNTSEVSLCVTAATTLPPAIVKVTNSNDSGPGSLREAMIEAMRTVGSGPASVMFEIPGVGPHTIRLSNPLPDVVQPLVIDGFSQPGARPNTLARGNDALLRVRIDGADAGIGAAAGLSLASAGSRIRGLELVAFIGGGVWMLPGTSNNVVEGCLITHHADSGIVIDDSAGNLVGGTAPSARNVISANLAHGIRISGSGASENRIQGNFIGTDFSGTSSWSNAISGVQISLASSNVIGGAASGAGNLISGNAGSGVIVEGGVSPAQLAASQILGNWIGTDASGAKPLSNGGAGVYLGISSGNIVGGTSPGHANRIAYNAGAGIEVSGGDRNLLRGNALLENGRLGIDLGATGPNANDPEDADFGANGLQNAPLLIVVQQQPGGLSVQGTLSSAANVAYTIDFYANTACDPVSSGGVQFGEGEFWLGSSLVTTDAGGQAAFNTFLPGLPPGRFLAATATDPDGNTSEFSPCRTIVSILPSATYVVTTGSDAGPGSLRQALLDHNQTFPNSNNVVRFSIPGAGVRTIPLQSPLPTIRQPLLLDGYSQPGAQPNAATNGGTTAVLLIRLDGANAGLEADGLDFASSSNIIRGLSIVRFSGHGIDLGPGGGNIIEGNYIGLDPAGSGISSSMAPAVAAPPSGNHGNGINGRSFGNIIGSVTHPNVVSANSGHGIAFASDAATSYPVQALIARNLVGTDPLGRAAQPNGGDGVFLTGATQSEVRENVISGNAGNGVTLLDPVGRVILGSGLGQNTVIRRNLIGVGLPSAAAAAARLASGFGSFLPGSLPALGNGRDGVHVRNGSRLTTVVVGGLEGSQGVPVPAHNVIAYNGGAGVAHSGANVQALNLVFRNTGLGLDTGAPGVSPANTPILTEVSLAGSIATIRGSIAVAHGSSVQVYLFNNTACDPSGYGEGEIFLGTVLASPDLSGVASFAATVALAGPANGFFTAHADVVGFLSSGGTEFSRCMQAGQAPDVFDWGDAPDSYGTRDASGGGRHRVTPGLFLGASVDPETDGQPSANARGDDQDPDGDDEDGVSFTTSLIPGQVGSVSVAVASALGIAPRLDAWIDFNRDGDWLDTGEHVLDASSVVVGDNVFEIDVPAAASTGATFARFRLSPGGVASPGGLVDGGEAEDHAVEIVAGGGGGGPAVISSVRFENGRVIVEWAGTELHQAPEVTGPWTQIPGAAKPYITDPIQSSRFYRALSN
jgi:hypothetical protein